MIRVIRTQERSKTIVTIDGLLSGESLCVVETCCNQAELEGMPVEVFLRDVTMVDEAGRTLLSRLAAKGVRLRARGLYTSYLVQTLTAVDKPSPDFRRGRPRRRNTESDRVPVRRPA